MKRTIRIVLAALLGGFLLPATFAQANQNNFPSKSVVYVGVLASIPSTCTVGQLSFVTNATAGQNIYECAAANTWTQQTGGSGTPCTTIALSLQFNNAGAFGCSPLTLSTNSNSSGYTADRISANITETLTGNTGLVQSLFDFQWVATVPATLTDVHLLNSGGTFNIHGVANQTIAAQYFTNAYNGLDGHSVHWLEGVFRPIVNTAAGAIVDEVAALYGTLTLPATNAGSILVARIGDLNWGGAGLVSSSVLPDVAGLSVGAPPAVTGGGSCTICGGINVNDISAASMGGTAAYGIAIGGTNSGTDIIPLFVFAGNAGRTVTNIARFSGGVIQAGGGIEVSSDVNTFFGSPSTGTKFQMTNNNANTCASWNDGTAGWELCELFATHSFVLQTNAAGANIFTATSTLMTMGQPLKITAVNATNLLFNTTAPTIAGAGCGGSGASIASNNGTASFTINTGTAPTAAGCTVTLPTATTGWNCQATDITTNSTGVFLVKQTGGSTTTAILQNFSDVAVATAPTANDIYRVQCMAY
jgi:hypothetical protein